MGFSARVRLELICAGQSFPLAQVGGDVMIFPEPVLLPADTGEVRIYIDNHVQTCELAWDHSAEPRKIVKARDAAQK